MWAYIFGAVCPRKGKGAGLVLPYCDTEAMQQHLAEISQAVDEGAHAVLILDQAGSDVTPKLKVPDFITLMFLPPRSPELNPVENVWQFLRDNCLSNRIFKDYDDIVAHSCAAWNKLVDQPWKIMSIGLREWAHRSRSPLVGITFHFTPTSCSWLNAVEGFFAKLSKRRLKRGVFHLVVDLQAAINRFLTEHNQQPKPFTWTADPDKIIAAVKRGHQVLDSIH
uniref:Rhizobium fredii repetitive sequence RFRS9 25 kDa protein n=1 Tax=Rhizobium fredii TaxID=380 RepID=Q52744_RHIFR|nr:25 kDa protein [Sinorhizobium fredii]